MGGSHGFQGERRGGGRISRSQQSRKGTTVYIYRLGVVGQRFFEGHMVF